MKSRALKERQINVFTTWKGTFFHSFIFTFSCGIKYSFGNIIIRCVILFDIIFSFKTTFIEKFSTLKIGQAGVKHRPKVCLVTFRTRNLMHIFLVITLLLCCVLCDT